MVNLCIGISMLFVPFATKSLINDGMTSAASALAETSTLAISKAVRAQAIRSGKGGSGELLSGFRGTRESAKNGLQNIQKRFGRPATPEKKAQTSPKPGREGVERNRRNC